MTVQGLCNRVTEFGFNLLKREFALDAQQHIVGEISASRKTLSWVRNPDTSLMTGNPARVGDYLYLLEHREYSYLMRDGGIVQIAFTFDDEKIERHRLVFHPCPFSFDLGDIEGFEGGLSDFITENYFDDLDNTMLLRSPVRFDYAPLDAHEFHPASHVTINDPACRIPARSALEFGTFIKFILENFYIDVWNDQAVRDGLAFAEQVECLSEHDKRRAYLTWA
jgi:hypothetical protein